MVRLKGAECNFELLSSFQSQSHYGSIKSRFQDMKEVAEARKSQSHYGSIKSGLF